MSKFKYRVRYTRKNNAGSPMACTEDVYGSSPLSALSSFHREMQLNRQLSFDKRTTLRPRLLPEDYSVQSIALMYNTDHTGHQRGETVESNYDLPENSKNPDLRKVKPLKEDTLMSFMDGLSSGRLSE